jgi:dephospho-CoA kinase
MNQTLIIQLVSGDQTLLKIEYPTELSREMLLERIPLLLETARTERTTEVSSEVSPKYEQLARFLARQQKDDLRMTFSQIEKEVNRSLPDSARTQRAWWANTLTHSQATAWMLTGWKVSSIDLENESVKFERA